MPIPYNRDLIYKTVCQALVDKQDDLQWGSFTVSDWRVLVPFARSQGVAPLLHYQASRNEWGAQLPPFVRQALEGEYYASAAYNQLLFSELHRILEVLDQAGIPVIVLKGAALAHNIYPDPALRPMNDIDLLVKPEHLFPAISTLKRIGYRQQKITYHAVLAGGPDSRVNLELHWLLLPSQDPEGLVAWSWEALELFQSDGLLYGEHYTLNRATYFVYLAAHLGLAHNAEKPRLIWLYDLHKLLSSDGAELDLGDITRLGEQFGWSLALAQTLGILEQHFSPPLPDRLLQLSTPVNDSPGQAVYFSDRLAYTRSFARQSMALVPFRGRLSVLSSTLFPSAAYIREKYRFQPSWLWPVGYVQRMADLLIHHGSSEN